MSAGVTELSLYHLVRENKVPIEKPIPLFLLHGYGSNEEDLFAFATQLPKNCFVISVRAPYSLDPFGYAWYSINFDAGMNKWSNDEEALKSRDLIADFITEACKHYGLDQEKATLIGFSQGSILSYSVALSYPEKVKNVIALSGYVNEKILKEGFEKQNLDHLQFYASHGVVDQVIPVAWAQRIPGFFKELGLECSYNEFPIGHGVSPQNFGSFVKWLQERIPG